MNRKEEQIRESTTFDQMKQVEAMRKQGYRDSGFDNQGFLMAKINDGWLSKVRVLRNGTVQRYKPMKPTGVDKSLYS